MMFFIIVSSLHLPYVFFFFFFNDTATTEIYTLSLHDALPTSTRPRGQPSPGTASLAKSSRWRSAGDRKSTRLNSKSRVDLVCRLLLEKKKSSEHQISGIEKFKTMLLKECQNSEVALIDYRSAEALDIPRTSRLLFFFNDTATTENYTLSLHDALPILASSARCSCVTGLRPAASGLRSSAMAPRSEEHTSELQSRVDLVCRLLREK